MGRPRRRTGSLTAAVGNKGNPTAPKPVQELIVAPEKKHESSSDNGSKPNRPKPDDSGEHGIWEGMNISVHNDVALMPVPETIAADDRKHGLWQFICSDLAHRGQLTSTYTLLVVEVVETIEALHAARTALSEQGTTVPVYSQKTGQPIGEKISPHFTMATKLQGVLLKLLEKLGMSPRDIHYLSDPSGAGLVPGGSVDSITETTTERVVYFRK
jgi:hypothetical protein